MLEVSNIKVSDISDIIDIALLVVTALGIIFAGIQMRQTTKINRANLVKELYFTLYNDKELRKIFYKIEWSSYDNSEWKKLDEEEEQCVDKLLTFFDIVCNMYGRKVLIKQDMDIFSYEMRRVYEHPAIQEYLTFLSNWQRKRGLGENYISYKKYCRNSYK